MSILAPKGRQHLAAAALFRLVRSGFGNIADHRCGEAEMFFTDALLSAFALFSLTSPARLAFDKERAEGHVHPIYGMEHVPGDTHRRERREPVSPASLRPVCQSVFGQLQRGKTLAPRVCFDAGSLLALEGTGDFSSQTIPGASCLHKVHRHGTLTSSHQM